MKKIAIVLSGCGFKDGSEITEATSCLIGLSEAKITYECFAPDTEISATNHIDDSQQEQRNILIESARIARGSIQPLNLLKETDFDGILFPGGFGAALHLCDWAKSGSSCTVHPDVEALLTQFHKASKPIGAICIAPVLVARVLGEHQPIITIGNDSATATEIEKTGATHENCHVTDYISDRENKILTTPAYMYDAKPYEVFTGINKMLKEFIEMS